MHAIGMYLAPNRIDRSCRSYSTSRPRECELMTNDPPGRIQTVDFVIFTTPIAKLDAP